MSDQRKESVSALMDGQAEELDLQRVLKHVNQEEIRTAWTRYHNIRQGVNGGEAAYQGIDISSRVMAALADEPAVNITSEGRWHNFLRPAASFAVAASFFSAVVVGSQFYGLLASPAGEPKLAAGVSTVGMVNTLGGSAVRAGYAAPTLKSAQTQQYTDYNKLAQARLQRYMLTHTEEAALNSPQGMMPFARVASFQVED